MTLTSDAKVLLAHGGGGKLSRELLDTVILPPLRNPVLDALDDGACLALPGREVVLTTDSYVVDPLFFPGGDIGRLAAAGTINDLTMQGARPLALTCGLIVEEGFSLASLRAIIQSLADTLEALGVTVVSGDTKVVERGKGGGVFLNTTGLGLRLPDVDVGIANGRPGDVILISGTLGDHGIAVMNERERLGLEADFCSDVAPLWPLFEPIFEAGHEIHCLRDPTRGGLTTALCDLAEAAGLGVRIRESTLPVAPPVQAACDLLGLEPLNVANEGKAMIVCPVAEAPAVLEQLRRHPLGQNAAIIGEVTTEHPGMAVLETPVGGRRILSPPAGFDLPRIC